MAPVLIFFNSNKFKIDTIFKIKSFGYNDTILLETFSIMRDGKNVSQEFPEIRELHIEQLIKIKDLRS